MTKYALIVSDTPSRQNCEVWHNTLNSEFMQQNTFQDEGKFNQPLLELLKMKIYEQ